MRLLLISNSTNAGEEYLKYPVEDIARFLGAVKEMLFVPYAAVSFSWDEYLEKVRRRMDDIGVRVRSVHEFADPAAAVERAEAVVVGGGNTFALLKNMQERGLMEPVRKRVRAGVPYIGWSAGSNVACPSLRTTNDMPIVEPPSFEALGFVPFQINPHYTDAVLQGHGGETREQRIEEFLAANREMWVAGLREGCMLTLEGERLTLKGPRPMRVFRCGQSPREVNAGDDLAFLMEWKGCPIPVK